MILMYRLRMHDVMYNFGKIRTLYIFTDTSLEIGEFSKRVSPLTGIFKSFLWSDSDLCRITMTSEKMCGNYVCT